FEESRSFYSDLGFEEYVISPGFSNFSKQGFTFYLQDYYVKDWIENTMLFFEVENVEQCWAELVSLNLKQKYPAIKLTPIVFNDWGRECFVHDPAGNLLHFGSFNNA
ncbi:MAG: glyoxalase, partial [Chitinophagaceae bacterium]